MMRANFFWKSGKRGGHEKKKSGKTWREKAQSMGWKFWTVLKDEQVRCTTVPSQIHAVDQKSISTVACGEEDKGWCAQQTSRSKREREKPMLSNRRQNPMCRGSWLQNRAANGTEANRCWPQNKWDTDTIGCRLCRRKQGALGASTQRPETRDSGCLPCSTCQALLRQGKQKAVK